MAGVDILRLKTVRGNNGAGVLIKHQYLRTVVLARDLKEVGPHVIVEGHRAGVNSWACRKLAKSIFADCSKDYWRASRTHLRVHALGLRKNSSIGYGMLMQTSKVAAKMSTLRLQSSPVVLENRRATQQTSWCNMTRAVHRCRIKHPYANPKPLRQPGFHDRC